MSTFQMPETMPEDKAALSATTLKIYKGRLNTLAKADERFTTVAGLRKHSRQACMLIKSMADDSDKGRVTKRGYLQAVLSVMDKKYRSKPNAYYKMFQTVMPSHTSDGSAWVPKADA